MTLNLLFRNRDDVGLLGGRDKAEGDGQCGAIIRPPKRIELPPELIVVALPGGEQQVTQASMHLSAVEIVPSSCFG